jgi:very-short-patch-repair endonuclease
MQVVERAIARIAARQDNVITGEQLRTAGLGRGAITHRVKAGTMQRLHVGVYLFGAAPPTPMARARAAVLAFGANAIASHGSAACLYGLLPDLGGDVNVTVVARNQAPRQGIRRHRVRPRHRAGVPGGPVPRHRHPPRNRSSARPRATPEGAPTIRSLIRDPRLTRSERERRLLKLIGAAQLPRPLSNVPLHGYKADIYWPAHKLIVEFDGWGAHGHRLAFDSNRKRDQVLLAAGLRVMRVTDRHLEDEPIAVTARIAQALR